MLTTPTVPSDTSILFLTVAALSPTQLGSGRQPSPYPFLDSLCEDGFTVNSCFATGGVTQIAVPSLMSSTLPLDYGGGEVGVLSRPPCLARPLATPCHATGAGITGVSIRLFFPSDAARRPLPVGPPRRPPLLNNPS
jgi:hypothetical protein